MPFVASGDKRSSNQGAQSNPCTAIRLALAASKQCPAHFTRPGLQQRCRAATAAAAVTPSLTQQLQQCCAVPHPGKCSGGSSGGASVRETDAPCACMLRQRRSNSSPARLPLLAHSPSGMRAPAAQLSPLGPHGQPPKDAGRHARHRIFEKRCCSFSAAVTITAITTAKLTTQWVRWQRALQTGSPRRRCLPSPQDEPASPPAP